MFLYRDQRGHTISFGFDMTARKADPGIICWDDGAGNWHPHIKNEAGAVRLDYPTVIAPDRVHESNAGVVVAHQPGTRIEMTYIGQPFIFSFSAYRT